MLLLRPLPFLIGAVLVASTSWADEDLTFSKDIAPILWTHCASCHRPGALAPFSLVDYKDAFPRARQIASAVRAGTMPPWLPEAGHGTFLEERRLSPSEIDRIERWARSGAREGDRRHLPPRPQWDDGWQLGTPDLVVSLPAPYRLPAGSGEVFRTFVLPIALRSPAYIRGVEIRPGNDRVVHHASLSVDSTPASRRLDEADPAPGFSGGMIASSARSPGNRAIGWTPGRRPALEPPGMAWRLDPESDLVLNLHLIAPDRGGPQLVQPSIGFYFTDAPPTRMPLDIRLGSKSIEIPAGAAAHTIEDRFTLPIDVEALSIYPHAHYLAREIRSDAVQPDGTIAPLLWIRRWDFHWQDEYRYTAPVALPAGTTLTLRFTYDNSPANPRAASPPRAVTYGPLSSDEMGDLWLRLVPRTPGDAATLVEAWRAHEARKDLEAAQRMVARYPREARWRSALAASYIDAGRTLEAIKHLEEALRLAPGDALVHLNLADALADRGEFDAAIEHYRRAIAINPMGREAHNNLGVALGSLGRLDEAIASFRAALDIDPGYADARANLATALAAGR